MKISDNKLAILIEKGVSTEKKMEMFAKAKELREAGTTVTIQPMKKNMKQQISLLEKEGYTQFEKVYRR
jgi:histidyl-tRNA synthetase